MNCIVSYLYRRRWLRTAVMVVLTTITVSGIGAQHAKRPRLDLLVWRSSDAGTALPWAWRTRFIRGRTAPATAIVDSADVHYLRISGTDRAAWFYRELEHPLDAASGRLEWSWRVPLAPAGANSSHAATDDAALRVFVVFARHSVFATVPRALFYTAADGEPIRSPDRVLSVNAIIAGRPGQLRDWTSAEANPNLDYQRSWGGVAPRIVAIGVMQDSDQTRSPAIGDLMRLQWRFTDDAIP